MDRTKHQAGVIAYRTEKGRREVLLITSRDTHRWIIPKGNIGKGKTALKAAKQEAYEEAGVRGSVASKIPLGFYMYFKRRDDGTQSPVSVEVYLLEVEKQLKKWPEKGARELRWLSIDEAIATVQEPGVVPLLQRVKELDHPM